MQTSTAAVATADIKRFTVAERSLHWAIVSAVLFNMTTGLFIWQGWDDNFKIGHFNPISKAHFFLGGGVIILSGLVFLALRRDRVEAAEKRMNIQQIFNLRAIQVLLFLMACTGIVLEFGRKLGVSKDARETIANVHLAFAGTVLALVLLHLFMVLLYPKNRGIVRGMVEGKVDVQTAQRVWPRWLEALGRR